jgi:hypothetical protein
MKTTVSVHPPNVNIPNFIKQALMGIQAQMDPDTINVSYFNTPLSLIDHSHKNKSMKKLQI